MLTEEQKSQTREHPSSPLVLEMAGDILNGLFKKERFITINFLKDHQLFKCGQITYQVPSPGGDCERKKSANIRKYFSKVRQGDLSRIASRRQRSEKGIEGID